MGLPFCMYLSCKTFRTFSLSEVKCCNAFSLYLRFYGENYPHQ
jgi:hypothetical protein